MRGAIALAICSAVGCSSEPASAPRDDSATTDSGDAVDATTDTSTAETIADAPAFESPPFAVACANPLPLEFACMPPEAKTGHADCTDAMLRDFAFCFGATADEAKCNAAVKAYPACSECVLSDWLWDLEIDQAACILAIDPSAECATVENCVRTCTKVVCLDCDPDPGGSPTSEYSDCSEAAVREGSATTARGPCWDVAAKRDAACRADARFAKCFVKAASDVVTFFRGACRDNGNWTKATVPDGT